MGPAFGSISVASPPCTHNVRRVTHRIERERKSYTQSFSLTREGTVALVPAVIP